MKKIIMFFIVVLMLGYVGCVGVKVKPEQIPAGDYPDNYEALIRDNLRETLVDPDSMNYFSIEAPPKLMFVPYNLVRYGLLKGQQVYECKIWYNAKNRMGGYSGKTLAQYYFRHGKIVAWFSN